MFRDSVWQGKQKALELYGEAQTRRVIKPQPQWERCPSCGRYLTLGTITGGDPDDKRCIDCHFGTPFEYWVNSKICGHLNVCDHQPCQICREGKPRYRTGQTYYVKEAANVYDDTVDWQIRYGDDSVAKVNPSEEWLVKHCADFLVTYKARTLPAWAARHFITVTDTKAQRVQEITEHEALLEGTRINDFIPLNTAAIAGLTTIDYYAQLWDTINKPPYDWASNSWVWCYTFKLAEGKKE